MIPVKSSADASRRRNHEPGSPSRSMATAAALQIEQRQRVLACVYAEDGKYEPAHRLSQRPWLANHFESLPDLINHRREVWTSKAKGRAATARLEFMQHLVKTYGNECRAWRHALDPQCKFVLHIQHLQRYCRSVDLRLPSDQVFASFDRDQDGAIGFEDLCSAMAGALASFRQWARASHESCAVIWNLPELEEVRWSRQIGGRGDGDGGWTSNKKMLCKDFAAGLRDAGFGQFSTAHRARIASCLSYHAGVVSREDLEWLDQWQAPAWLTVDADPYAHDDLMRIVRKAHAMPLRAWRLLFDVDHCNSVDYLDFSKGCKVLDFRGNVAGAWRYMDTSFSGAISLKEFDEPIWKLVKSFQASASECCGSMADTFGAFDQAQGGSLSYEGFQKGCVEVIGWGGDARTLFDSMEGGNGSIEPSMKRPALTLEDFLYLECILDKEVDTAARGGAVMCSDTGTKAMTAKWTENNFSEPRRLPTCLTSKLPPSAVMRFRIGADRVRLTLPPAEASELRGHPLKKSRADGIHSKSEVCMAKLKKTADAHKSCYASFPVVKGKYERPTGEVSIIDKLQRVRLQRHGDLHGGRPQLERFRTAEISKSSPSIAAPVLPRGLSATGFA